MSRLEKNRTLKGYDDLYDTERTSRTSLSRKSKHDRDSATERKLYKKRNDTISVNSISPEIIRSRGKKSDSEPKKPKKTKEIDEVYPIDDEISVRNSGRKTFEANDTPEDGTTPGVKKPRQTPCNDTVLDGFDSLIEMLENEIQRLKDGPSKTKGNKFLRSVNKRVKELKTQTTRVMKQKTKTPRRNTENTGFNKPMKISRDLAKFTGWNEDEHRSRTDVTRYICQYVKDNDLKNKDDGRHIDLDSKLRKLLNVHDSSKPFRYCDIQSRMTSENLLLKEDKDKK